MFVLCVLYSKGQKTKPGQSGQRSTNKVKNILPEAGMSYVCCMLSGRGLCDELITRPEESYRQWCGICVI
jgi:hypothetical protein